MVSCIGYRSGAILVCVSGWGGSAHFPQRTIFEVGFAGSSWTPGTNWAHRGADNTVMSETLGNVFEYHLPGGTILRTNVCYRCGDPVVRCACRSISKPGWLSDATKVERGVWEPQPLPMGDTETPSREVPEGGMPDSTVETVAGEASHV